MTDTKRADVVEGLRELRGVLRIEWSRETTDKLLADAIALLSAPAVDGGEQGRHELNAWAKTIDSIALDVVPMNFAAGTALMACAAVIRNAAARTPPPSSPPDDGWSDPCGQAMKPLAEQKLREFASSPPPCAEPVIDGYPLWSGLPSCADEGRGSSAWASEQYNKIQDFVIGNRLFKDQPKDKSHADIVIALAEKTLRATREDAGRRQPRRTVDDPPPGDGDVYVLAWLVTPCTPPNWFERSAKIVRKHPDTYPAWMPWPAPYSPPAGRSEM